MSERITDERLAAIEVCHVEVEPVDITDTWFYFEELPGYTTELAHKQRGELLQALKAERAEVVRLKQEQVDFEYNASCIISTEERRAEAAEAKLRGANAEIERQKGLVRNYLETIEGNEIDIAGLLEKLRAVGELPGKWREKYAPIVKSDGSVWRAAANELEALLK